MDGRTDKLVLVLRNDRKDGFEDRGIVYNEVLIDDDFKKPDQVIHSSSGEVLML